MFIISLALIAAATSCKGRTADNMIPAGDTVEVNIDSTEIIVSEAPDTMSSAPADTVGSHINDFMDRIEPISYRDHR